MADINLARVYSHRPVPSQPKETQDTLQEEEEDVGGGSHMQECNLSFPPWSWPLTFLSSGAQSRKAGLAGWSCWLRYTKSWEMFKFPRYFHDGKEEGSEKDEEGMGEERTNRQGSFKEA